MEFCGDDVQAAEFRHTWRQLDVGAASGHIGGNRDASLPTRFGDNHGLMRILSRVEQVVGKAALPQQQATVFGSGHGTRTYQYRTVALVNLRNAVDHSLPFLIERVVDAIGPSVTPDRTIRRDARGRKPVDRPKLSGHFVRGSRHPCKPEIAPKEALVANPRELIHALSN